MADLEDSVQDSYMERSSWKARAGKAVMKGISKGAYGIFIWPLEKSIETIKSRRYNVVPQEMVVVLNRNYQLSKDELALQEINLMIGLGTAPEQIYKNKKELFAKGAKIQGPRGRKYFKWPFQHPIRIETYPQTLNPEQREETAFFYGVPITLIPDTRIIIQKNPILFSEKNGGRLVRKDGSWEKDLNDNLTSEAYAIVHEHFQTYPNFPEVCTAPLDHIHIHRRKREILENYGVNVEIKVERFRILKGQEEIMARALEQRALSLANESASINNFLGDLEKISKLSNRVDFSQGFLTILSELNKYRSCLGNGAYVRAPVYKSGEIPADAREISD